MAGCSAICKRNISYYIGFPPKEKFGLSNQIRRVGVSVLSIIAESSSNKSHKEQSHF
ncbi:MAG: four helix bundle protein [Candidatus Cloacimonetes bacterium]|nr:four helix bundle protein [Candidatus Cloacimonadota bacterium]